MLEAAGQLFARKGFDATSIAEIGEAADIAKSVLYHYFGSKSGLYEALLESESRALVDRVAVSSDGDAGGPPLRGGIDAYLQFLAERPAAGRLLLREPPAEPALAAAHRRLAAEREAALARLLASPAKRRDRATHVGLLATALRAFALWWLEHPEVPREDVVAAVLDVAQAGASRLPVSSRRAPAPNGRGRPR